MAQEFMMLVVNRRTGEVLDCENGDTEYSWHISDALTKLLDRHDLNEVDILVSVRTTTKSQEVATGSEGIKPETAPINTDEDIPF